MEWVAKKKQFLVNKKSSVPPKSPHEFLHLLFGLKQKRNERNDLVGQWGSKKSDDTLGTYYGKPYINI